MRGGELARRRTAHLIFFNGPGSSRQPSAESLQRPFITSRAQPLTDTASMYSSAKSSVCCLHCGHTTRPALSFCAMLSFSNLCSSASAASLYSCIRTSASFWPTIVLKTAS